MYSSSTPIPSSIASGSSSLEALAAVISSFVESQNVSHEIWNRPFACMTSSWTRPWLVMTADTFRKRRAKYAIRWILLNRKKGILNEKSSACGNWRWANILKWHLNMVVYLPLQVMYLITKLATSPHGCGNEFWSYPWPFWTTFSLACKNALGNSGRVVLHENHLCPCWGSPLTSAMVSLVTRISIPQTRELYSSRLSVNSIAISSLNPCNLSK